MRKFKRVISGLLAGIMLSAVIAPLIDAIPVYAAGTRTIQEASDNSGTSLPFKIELVKDFSVGTLSLSEKLKYVRVVKGSKSSYAWVDVNSGCETANGYVRWGLDDSYNNTVLDFDNVTRTGADKKFGYAYMEQPEDIIGKSGFELYCDWIRNIRNKAGQHIVKINDIVVSEDEDKDGFAKRLRDDLSFDTTIELDEQLYSIWAGQQAFEDGNDTDMVFMACDYDIIKDRYVYYIAIAQRDRKSVV